MQRSLKLHIYFRDIKCPNSSHYTVRICLTRLSTNYIYYETIYYKRNINEIQNVVIGACNLEIWNVRDI